MRWAGRGKSKVEQQVQKRLLEEVLVNRETQHLLRDFVLDLDSYFSETDSPSCRLRVGFL